MWTLCFGFLHLIEVFILLNEDLSSLFVGTCWCLRQALTVSLAVYFPLNPTWSKWDITPDKCLSICTFHRHFGISGDTTYCCSVMCGASLQYFPLTFLLPGSSPPPSELGGKPSRKGCSQTVGLVLRLPSDTGFKVAFILLLRFPLWRLASHPCLHGFSSLTHRYWKGLQKTRVAFLWNSWLSIEF